MDRGSVVLQGTPKEVFAKVEQLKSYGLEVPQVTEIAYRLKKAGVDIAEGILTEDEFVTELVRIKET